jgi:hypothetical protein
MDVEVNQFKVFELDILLFLKESHKDGPVEA